MAKIGIEWVKKYHGRASNLSNTQKQAEGFYNKLSGTRAFNWGDDLAWDQDFEEKGIGSPATGTDTTWIDSVHIAFFSGHGGPTGPLFGVAGYDDGRAHNTEIRWGNKTLNWIAFDACELLRHEGYSKYFLNKNLDASICGDDRFSGKAYFFSGDYYIRYDWNEDVVDIGYPKRIRDHWHGWPNSNDDVFDRWGDAFKGLHTIFGFHTTCGDESKRGRYFAEYLNDGYTVIEAWKKACKETEGSGTKWAYLRSGGGSGVNTYNDHWHGKGWVSPDPTNTWRAYSKGSC